MHPEDIDAYNIKRGFDLENIAVVPLVEDWDEPDDLVFITPEPVIHVFDEVEPFFEED